MHLGLHCVCTRLGVGGDMRDRHSYVFCLGERWVSPEARVWLGHENRKNHARGHESTSRSWL